MVTWTLCESVAPAASPPDTSHSSVANASVRSIVVLSERHIPTLNTPADEAPWFSTVTSTLTVPSASAMVGPLTEVTTRSGMSMPIAHDV